MEYNQVWCLPVKVKLNNDKKKSTENISTDEMFSVFRNSLIPIDYEYYFYNQKLGYKKLKGKGKI